MANNIAEEVRVTIKVKTPQGYQEQFPLVFERGTYGRALQLTAPVLHDPFITINAIATPNLPDDTSRHLLITAGIYNIDNFNMHTLPFPSSAFSGYLQILLSSPSLEAGPLLHLTSGIYSLLIVDREGKHIHMFACNLRQEQQQQQHQPPSIVVPYEAPPVGERALTLGFVVFRQTGYIELENQDVTNLQTRDYGLFSEMNNPGFHMVGCTYVLLGPEVVPLHVASAA